MLLDVCWHRLNLFERFPGDFLEVTEFSWVSRQCNHAHGTRGCGFKTVIKYLRITKLYWDSGYNVFGI